MNDYGPAPFRYYIEQFWHLKEAFSLKPLFPTDARLELFSRVIVGLVGSKHPDLTLRQMATLLLCCGNTGDALTASTVAAQLNVSKPVLTRSLDRLEQLGLVRREQSRLDRRKNLIRPTAACPNFIQLIEVLLGSVRV